jgi:integrase
MGRKPNPRPRKVTIVRYELPGGKRCPKGTPGAKKITTKSDSYYLTLPRPGGGKERVALGTTDEAVAWAEVRRILAERHQEALGISDDRTRQAARPIAEHVAEWIGAVEAGGVSGKRVRMLRSRVERLIVLAKWQRVGEIRKSSLQTALAKLQDAGHGKGRTQSRGRGSVGEGKGVSAQTRNHYLASVRQFTAWLVDEQRLPADPLAGLKGVSVSGDRRHDRRVPSDEDVRVLFAHLQGAADPAPVRMGMTGPQRALGYAVAMCAGLRAGELRRLTRESRSTWARARCASRASSDKAKRRRRMALPGWLVERVRDWLDAGGGLWEGFPECSPAGCSRPTSPRRGPTGSTRTASTRRRGSGGRRRRCASTRCRARTGRSTSTRTRCGITSSRSWPATARRRPRRCWR